MSCIRGTLKWKRLTGVLPRPRELFGKKQTEVVKLSDCDTKTKVKNKKYVEYLEKCIAYRMNVKA